ncbi:MAG: class D beta-lactamase [Chlorobiales bacterium]|nr:class D beta-lactamase [Chlorobiales bacterium]
MRTLLLILFFLLFSLQAFAQDQAIAKLFARRGTEGTIVLSSLRSGQTFVHNSDRAKQRFSPASSFKILNILIALEEKAIPEKDDTLKWDGKHYDLPDWNRDQTLESAFRVSCVWYFQELARHVGAEKYRNYLKRLGYGQLHEPFETTTFWLDGSLEISAIEQVDFLRKVYQRALPFGEPAYETLRKIMVVETSPAFTIRAKTGWAARTTPQIGWYVGYVETRNDVWFFALNMTIKNEADLPIRKDLTREILQEKGIIE